MSTALVETEAARLQQLEAEIETLVAAFVQTGAALREIRDARLYRQEYKTFESYCRERWGFTKTQANRLVQSAEVIELVTPTGVIPANERQARELAPLLDEPEELVEAWAEASADGEPTTEKVKEAVTKRRDDIPDPDPQMLLDERPCPTCGRWTPQWVIARVSQPEGQTWRWLANRGKTISRSPR